MLVTLAFLNNMFRRSRDRRKADLSKGVLYGHDGENRGVYDVLSTNNSHDAMRIVMKIAMVWWMERMNRTRPAKKRMRASWRMRGRTLAISDTL